MSTTQTQQRRWRDILGQKKPEPDLVMQQLRNPVKPEDLDIGQDEERRDPLQPIHDLADGYVMRKASLEVAIGMPGEFSLDDLHSPPPETSMTHLSEWIAALDELLYYRPRPMDYAAGLSMRDADQRITHLLLDLRAHQELCLAAIKALSTGQQ
jgi:hypothetical protein